MNLCEIMLLFNREYLIGLKLLTIQLVQLTTLKIYKYLILKIHKFYKKCKNSFANCQNTFEPCVYKGSVQFESKMA